MRAMGQPKSSKIVKIEDVVLETPSSNDPYSISIEYGAYSNNSEYSDFSEFEDESSPDGYSNFSSSADGRRMFPESQLNIKQLARLKKEKSKMYQRKRDRKEKRLKINEQKKKVREDKEKAQQDIINAEKLKIIEERQRQQEAMGKGLNRYEISAIEFDWLFNEKHGRNFIVELTKVKSLEIFSIDLIIKIILYLWGFYRRAIVIRVMIPFMIYFGVFLFYALWIHFEKAGEENDDGGWHAANLVLIIIIAIFIVYNIYFEIMKIYYYRDQYFVSYWNAINVISTSFNTFVIIADLADLDESVIIPFLSIALLLMHLRVLYFGRLFFSTAWMVRMISSVTKDMRYFLFIFIYVVVAFADAYLIINRNGDPPIFEDNFFDAFIYSYQNGLGEFNLENFDQNRDSFILYVMWVISTFLILVVFLNLLIAIISDIFDKIHENIQNNLIKELVYFMVESEVLINRRKLFKKHKYIIIVSRERGKSTPVDAETRLQIIKNSMENQVSIQNNHLNEIYKRLEKDCREKIQNKAETLDISVTKKMNGLTKLIEETDSVHSKYEIVFDSLMRS